mgnify:CR=1 FL=1
MIIFMWSGPRNLSTALMRSFENRKDTKVIDEPFYSYYLKKTALRHPMYKEIINTYSSNFNEVIDEITKLPANIAIYYQKHMTHHLLDEINLDWLSIGKNCFLIRHPAKVINSYIKKNHLKDIRDIGFRKQYEIFNFIKDNYDSYPITIDSDDILKNPKEKIKKLCVKLNIKFTERMINWPKGKRESDGIWSIVWYEQVNNSSTFQNYTENNLEIPKKYNGIYEESLEIYNQMKKFSL